MLFWLQYNGFTFLPEPTDVRKLLLYFIEYFPDKLSESALTSQTCITCQN
jgi:hypothetical protein